MTHYTDMQLDALRELANIGSGNAGTALSAMLGQPVDISVPAAKALPLANAVEAAGDPETLATGVVLPIFGDIDATVVLLFPPDDEAILCTLLGVEPGTEDGYGALGEIGNILGCSYVNSLAEMTGLAIEPRPPETVADMVGAILASVLAVRADSTNLALVMDSRLIVEGQECELTFLLLPSLQGIDELLGRLGLA
ncbi:MAG TPA: chemotaxis protein CheC [Capillimicrobium sp.]|jgi:chemotaxis protein CheC|nr:chemotaxis protein CheC [Capillimicrobium sp.]